MAAATAAQQRYWDWLIRGRCIITHGPATIAHCHGGSIVERMQEAKAKGKRLERYNWLVLPLAPALAIEVVGGEEALDANVERWEAKNGTQAQWIDYLAGCYGVDLWALAAVRRQKRHRIARDSKILPRRGICL